jgi:hypothetical protein
MQGGMETYRTAKALHNCSLWLADGASTPMARIGQGRSRGGAHGHDWGPGVASRAQARERRKS